MSIDNQMSLITVIIECYYSDYRRLIILRLVYERSPQTLPCGERSHARGRGGARELTPTDPNLDLGRLGLATDHPGHTLGNRAALPHS